MRRWNFSKTEAGLWLLFLFACMGFGYFQGVRPDFRVFEYILPPTPVQILTFSEAFFPPDVIAELEHETHSKIQLSLIKDWDQLQLQLISAPSPEIVFLPSYWAHTLNQQGLLHDDSPLRKKFSKFLATDFSFSSNPQEGDGDFFPVYWAKLSFYSQRKKQNTLAFLDDSELFLSYQERQDLSDFTLSLFKLSRWFNDEAFSEDLFLSTHVLAQRHSEWKIQETLPSAMFTMGFVVPKNSPQLGKALKIINHYVSFEVQNPLLERFPFASTLNLMEESHLIAEKKSSFLRSLEVSQLILPKPKEAGSKAQAQKATQSIFSR